MVYFYRCKSVLDGLCSTRKIRNEHHINMSLRGYNLKVSIKGCYIPLIVLQYFYSATMYWPLLKGICHEKDIPIAITTEKETTRYSHSLLQIFYASSGLDGNFINPLGLLYFCLYCLT